MTDFILIAESIAWIGIIYFSAVQFEKADEKAFDQACQKSKQEYGVIDPHLKYEPKKHTFDLIGVAVLSAFFFIIIDWLFLF